MKSFKTHLVEERRQLNEAFPVLFVAALGARIFVPIILRHGIPMAFGTTNLGLLGRAATVLGLTRYREDPEKFFKDFQGTIQFVVNLIPDAWKGGIEAAVKNLKYLVIALIVLLGALAVLEVTLPVARRMISRMMRRREVVSAVKEELEQGDIEAAQQIMAEALSKENPDIRLTDLQKVLSSDDFNKATRELHQKL